ncbi:MULTISPECIES: Gldg family protein [unclassified Bradyrhizobium]|uniref:Gldg family protein n=1 Tax=unclassified Bradyrhizobium TaxID=2631580 RepID=UPI00247A0620|nr:MULTISPECIES: Gldg family protein [unclassified Bradyrhizobium]WGS18505.1 Gldg family protein [Bradyrhizobium sp. ISRA463]WGS25330.1 Gldg family protein [Bradyrhizobium sp. ISRA464]
MSRFVLSDLAVAALIAAAILFGALGFAVSGDKLSNSLFFAAWLITLLTLFALAVRLPLRGRGSRWSALAANALIVAGAIGVAISANVALYRHDVHFDATREGQNTPPQQLTDVVDQLRSPLAMTYFYNASDPNALATKEMIEISARNHPLFSFRAIDLDKEPGLARDIGVRSYNTAVLQAGDHKVLVENITDAARLGYAALRVLRKRAETICFVTGHGETFRPVPSHYHFSHVETLRGHDIPGAGDVLVAEPEQLDRLQLALNEIGFDMRPLVTATASAIPSDCTVVAEIGPRAALAAGEADLLADHLKSGGRLVMLIDPQFYLGAELKSRLLEPLGVSTDAAIVIDPLNHFRTDPDKVAVPYYPPHPITARLALTVFAQTRPIHLAKPPATVRASVLAASSQDSSLRPPSAAGSITVAAGGQAASEADHGAQALAVAFEGAFPGAAPDKHFRLVIAGTSKFATNEYFSYVSNGELSVAIMRWLAEDDAAPNVAPRTYTVPEIVLTSAQMRNTFIALEVLLPFTTALFGVAMWWRRR